MPLITPSKTEKQSEKGKQEFISRCMGDETINKDFPDQKQRAAVCYSQWDRAKKKNKADWEQFSKEDLGSVIVY
jgi:hypothetical protein